VPKPDLFADPVSADVRRIVAPTLVVGWIRDLHGAFEQCFNGARRRFADHAVGRWLITFIQQACGLRRLS
jgi:hypothetical protein